MGIDPFEIERVRTNAAIKIQTRARGCIARKHALRVKSMVRAAMVIQKYARGYMVRKQRTIYMKELLDHKLSALSQLSVSLRHKAYQSDIKYYCELWKTKTRRNIQERHMNARKSFVYYS